MKKETVQHIEENGVALAIQTKLQIDDLPIVPMPANYELVSIEKYLSAPLRFRGKFSTNYVKEFTGYVLDSMNGGGQHVFINAQKMFALGMLDLGTPSDPLHGDHRAVVTLEKLNAFTALLSMNGARKSQKDMAEWMEDWRDYLEAYQDASSDGSTKIDMKAAIAAVRTLTLKATAEREHTTQDFKASKSSLESIEASSKGHALPGYLYFTCKPYEEIKERTFVCRLSAITGDTPVFGVRIIQLEAHVEKMGKEFKLMVQEQLKGSAVSVRLGEFERG